MQRRTRERCDPPLATSARLAAVVAANRHSYVHPQLPEWPRMPRSVTACFPSSRAGAQRADEEGGRNDGPRGAEHSWLFGTTDPSSVISVLYLRRDTRSPPTQTDADSASTLKGGGCTLAGPAMGKRDSVEIPD